MIAQLCLVLPFAAWTRLRSDGCTSPASRARRPDRRLSRLSRRQIRHNGLWTCIYKSVCSFHLFREVSVSNVYVLFFTKHVHSVSCGADPSAAQPHGRSVVLPRIVHIQTHAELRHVE